MAFPMRMIAVVMAALAAATPLATAAPASRSLPLGLARGTQTDAGDQALRSLSAVALWVEEVGPEARAMGLDEDWLRRRMSAALGRDSIGVLPPQPVRVDLGQPYLIARLQTTGSRDVRVVAWHLGLALHRRALLPTADTLRVVARVWEAGEVTGLTTPSELRASIGEAFDRQLREFTRAWGSRNAPAGAGSAAPPPR
jgi:hypothetical protein